MRNFPLTGMDIKTEQHDIAIIKLYWHFHFNYLLINVLHLNSYV